MKKRTVFIFFLLLIASLTLSCHTRKSIWDYEPQDVLKLINGIGQKSAVGTSAQNLSQFMAMVNDPKSTIYFVDHIPEYSAEYGPIESIAALNDKFWTQFDQRLNGREDIKEIRFYFADRIVQDNQNHLLHKNILIVEYSFQQSGQLHYVSYTNTNNTADLGVSTKADFATTLRGGNGQILEVSSIDVDTFNGGLSTNIQLQISIWDRSSPEPLKVGKIRSLQGFQGSSF